jgi:hypothetical protein
MPPGQLVLLRLIGIYRSVMDEQTILFSLPPTATAARRSALKSRLTAMAESNDPLLALMARMIPTTEKVHEACQRIERRIDYLRTIEAIRMTSVNGQPPASLAAIRSVPVPVDPLTGEQFRYSVRENTVELFAPAPRGETANAGNSIRFTMVFRPSR